MMRVIRGAMKACAATLAFAVCQNQEISGLRVRKPAARIFHVGSLRLGRICNPQWATALAYVRPSGRVGYQRKSR